MPGDVAVKGPDAGVVGLPLHNLFDKRGKYDLLEKSMGKGGKGTRNSYQVTESWQELNVATLRIVGVDNSSIPFSCSDGKYVPRRC